MPLGENFSFWALVIGLPAFSWVFYRLGLQDGVQQCLQFLEEQGVIELEEVEEEND